MKKNYINQEDIRLNESYCKKFLKYDFDGKNGKKIANKFRYLKNSILNNTDKLKNNKLERDEKLEQFKDTKEDIEYEMW